ncbi:transcription elongation factor GreA [Candidatus Uhrbacteria bacterium CG_4_9_14_3_um_filter_36_7]|uniref:Transcription elongation factor GreA n=1 Tax=Candidatus Uhrbacteria bacterium CG_4_9_14_3_um_filter_36_7 TaxID=1975033 RepID=A0A2M7XI10_9BACT|nr:MAG: transcription elongation factor GreA [Candidatus Uhrbacteria bacterium CG_4_9_14_3_um_filter_36_7]
MRLPLRKSEQLRQTKKQDEEGSEYITASGLKQLEDELKRLQTKDLPKAIEDVSFTIQFGDLSENAEYQEAKWRLRRTHSRIAFLQDKIKRAVIIQKNISSETVQIGSTVLLKINHQKEQLFQIVGPSQANPLKGRISHISPLGKALLGNKIHDSVEIKTTTGITVYTILKIE